MLFIVYAPTIINHKEQTFAIVSMKELSKMPIIPFSLASFPSWILIMILSKISNTSLSLFQTLLLGNGLRDTTQYLKYSMNHCANHLATKFQHRKPQRFTNLCEPLPTPNNKVHLLFDRSLITAQYYSALAKAMYDNNLKTHIIRKAKWTEQQFSRVGWDY